jgi:hypothetical protein
MPNITLGLGFFVSPPWADNSVTTKGILIVSTMPIEMIVVQRIVKITTNRIAVTDIVTKIFLIRIGTVHVARTQVVMILNTVLQECMVLEAGLLLRHAILCKVHPTQHEHPNLT